MVKRSAAMGQAMAAIIGSSVIDGFVCPLAVVSAMVWPQ